MGRKIDCGIHSKAKKELWNLNIVSVLIIFNIIYYIIYHFYPRGQNWTKRIERNKDIPFFKNVLCALKAWQYNILIFVEISALNIIISGIVYISSLIFLLLAFVEAGTAKKPHA